MSLSLGPCVPALGLHVQVSGLHKASKVAPSPPWSLASLGRWGGGGTGQPQLWSAPLPRDRARCLSPLSGIPRANTSAEGSLHARTPACQGLLSGAWFSHRLLCIQQPSTWTATCYDTLSPSEGHLGSGGKSSPGVARGVRWRAD